MLGKRAVSDTAIDWVVALLISSIALIILMVIVGSFTTRDINTQNVEAEVFYSKVYYTLGVEFGEEEFVELFSYENPHLGATLTILDMEGNNITSVSQNKDTYSRLEPMARNNIAGAGLYKNFTYPVVYENENAFLQIEVVVE